jgi:Bacteriophage Lambda NinG protein
MYRAELIRRIGLHEVERLEGPHETRKWTIEELKAIKAEYRAKAKALHDL